ncbi:hypothetical protein Adt_41819 [Abeliophyllum distichum]|uniref:Uncharacterized protein n=1 Tax=Abeliophyllum distichum TaxID=126358 RepID=A0ABD1PRH5_9LAMI
MVLKKDKQLAEATGELERAKEELATLKASIAEAEASVVSYTKKSFWVHRSLSASSPSMAKYTFSKISIFSIDEEEDDDENVSPSLLSPVLDSSMDASSLFLSRELLLSSESVRQGKENVIAEEEGHAHGKKRDARKATSSLISTD